MPSQIALIDGEVNKVHNVGIILPLGALVALLVTPIAGALSDRSRSRLGRRSVFLISGGMINLIFLAAMALFGSGDSLALFMRCWLGLQFGANWWGGPYAGMIPDFIAEGERGMASGWMMAMSYVGTILGAGVASALLPLNYAAVYALTALLLVGGLGVTIGGVKEWAWPATHPPASNASFFPGLEGNVDFWLVLLTRSFMTMGSFTFLPFFAFFLRDAFQLPTNDDASQLFGLLLATTSALALPTALLGGRWADRHGPLREVRLGGCITAACGMALAFVALRPGMASLLVVALVLAQGSALYQAVDWALAIAVLIFVIPLAT